MKKSIPIVHIIGLPGAGKSTLARKLSRRLKLPIYGIGKYRSRFPDTPVGEADAWIALFRELSRRKWKNCVLETTGLNCRESFLRAAFPMRRIITIKLEAQRKVLYSRIAKKRKDERGGKWLFSASYRDKYEFVRKMFKEFKSIPAEVKVDTTKLSAGQVYKTVLEKLSAWK
jgi:shikimate kinase